MAVPKTIILITGANGGIGFDTVAALAASSSDYHVFLGSRSVEKGQKAVQTIESRGVKGAISLLQLDVTSQESVDAAYKTVHDKFGRLDVLINNAGIVADETLPNPQQLRLCLETNTIGALTVTEAFVPLLQKSSDPRLIYVSSCMGSLTLRVDKTSYVGGQPFTPYRATKAALNMLAVSHARDYAEWGCKVWTFCPGYVVTNLTGEEDRENRIKNGASSSEVSGDSIMRIVQGERDGEAGCFVHKDGQYPW